jgi:CubicO group peptidase (beta-lactamase class C family)
LNNADRDSLRAILRKAVDNRVAPGVSLLLARGGEIIFKEGFGNLKPDQSIPIASSTKPVTATMVMVLVDKGTLALDDPIDKYLPEFKEVKVQGRKAKIPPRSASYFATWRVSRINIPTAGQNPEPWRNSCA